MKLDPTVMRTMSPQDFRVLEAVEKGMKDHALVPLPLVSSIANLRHGGCHKIISSLLRDKLLSHENKRQSQVDGYRITNAGYDILALHHLKRQRTGTSSEGGGGGGGAGAGGRGGFGDGMHSVNTTTNGGERGGGGVVAALGPRIGTGKESDVYLGVDPQGRQLVLKFHRLGRTSFRSVRKNRDYSSSSSSSKNQAHSWLFLSRLSALKEYAFMKALHDVGYPTPTPIAHNRHVVCMSLVRGIPLYQIYPSQLSVEQAQDIYEQAADLTARLARHGLVHCDLNEFNLLVDLSGIQAKVATRKDEDPYVRHSGQSVAGTKSLGALSKPSFWDQAHQPQVAPQSHHLAPNKADDDDEKEEKGAAPDAEPVAYLPNGQPKPVVTLIDFPQMVSISHPNAQELYQRDLACLDRFFTRKLLCQIGDVAVDVRWESVVGSGAGDDGNEGVGGGDGSTTQSSAPRPRQQLDAQLRASGYTPKQCQDLELYYYESGPRPIASAIDEVEDEEDDEDEDDSEEDERGESDDDSTTSGDRAAGGSDPAKGEGERGGDRFARDVEEESSDDDDDVPASASAADLVGMDREQMRERAKAQVRRQIEGQKRKDRKHGAFRKRNSNKTFVKGKRVFSEAY
jgi:RIO kinase 2